MPLCFSASLMKEKARTQMKNVTAALVKLKLLNLILVHVFFFLTSQQRCQRPEEYKF
jgi:hypothetical protein